MPQALLPIFLDDARLISPTVSYQRKDGFVYYFQGAMPNFSHGEDDNVSFSMFTRSQLIDNGACRVVDAASAFGVSEISMKRNLAKFREHGPRCFSRSGEREALGFSSACLSFWRTGFSRGLTRVGSTSLPATTARIRY